MQVEPCKAWFPKQSGPTVELWSQRDWKYIIIVITENGPAFFSQTEEYITAQHAKQFILALQVGFQEVLIVMLDGGPNFQALAVIDLTDSEEISFVRLPAFSPELNLVEECWRSSKPRSGSLLPGY